jgi:tRNA nucleotidyltransferase/poly(A) polymerase
MAAATLPSLAGADWLESPAVKAVFRILEAGGDEARVVGGAVRNALMGLPVGDIDFAATATPDIVSERAAAAGAKVVPTGIEHGTVTLVVHGRGFEVTTLREDIETDGRHAVVRFGRDWQKDALRRDFTVNALSVDSRGVVHDPVGGYPDIVLRRIRFIGDPDRRIAEDRLRILRLFRFQAQVGEGAIDRDGLGAAIRARNGIRELSAERIGQEIRRLVIAPRALDAVTIMQDSGILPIVFGGVAYLGPFARLADAEASLGTAPASALRLAALATSIEEDVERLAPRLRLTNAERERMTAAVVAAAQLHPPPEPPAARALLYRLGAGTWRDGVLLATARGGLAGGKTRELFSLPDRWPPPTFPLRGRDLLPEGIPRGPAIGAMLKAVEDWWVENDFRPDETALRQRLQQMAAGAQ